MSIYSDSTTQPRRQSARYFEYPPRRGADVSSGPRVEVYEKEPALPRRYPDEKEPLLPRRYADSDQESRDTHVVRSRPIRVRAASPDDYKRNPRRKSMVIRPRSTSRVRIREPASGSVAADSSSDEDEPRRRRRDRGNDTRIRATSRPGKKNEYAFVRSASKGRKRSDARAPVVHDLELKTDRRHRDFQSRRDDLENTEALVLVRARSQDRERGGYDEDDSDGYDGRRRQSHHKGESRRKRGSVDDSLREIVIARDDRDRDDRRRSTRDPTRYSYGKGPVAADFEEEPRSERRAGGRRRVSLSPDRDTVDSSSLAGGSVRRASTVSSRGQKPRRSRQYDDLVIDPDTRRDPRRDSAYATDSERRAKEREREAIEREKRAIDREKAALDREKLLVDREKRVPAGARDVPDDRNRGAADYLKQGDKYLKDGQKYYKSGSGLVNGMKNLLK